MRRAALGVLVVFGLCGCSQIAAVAPVGGDHLAQVRFATGDILVAQGVSILSGPDCEQQGDVVSCTGETVDGDTITTASTATTMTVTVGSTQLYTGSIEDALDAALRPAS